MKGKVKNDNKIAEKKEIGKTNEEKRKRKNNINSVSELKRELK